tara:strand:+ start:560 stop:838 length:279 start_codon:yes stop_codon:yes gene_type:complete
VYNYIQRIDIEVGQGNPCKHSCCASPFNYFYFIHKCFPLFSQALLPGLFVCCLIKHAKMGIGQQAEFTRADGILCVDAQMASFCPSDLTAFE